MTEIFDIRAQAPFPAGALSNLAPHAFLFDGIACESMEGFLQSLKIADQTEQRRICTLVGPMARSAGRKHEWRTSGTLWWKGEAVDRLSVAYQLLLDRAFQALFDQSEDFRRALAATDSATLTHRLGKDDPCETILTRDELCSRLCRLRSAERLA